MRFHSFSGSSVWMEYPDAIVWLGDHNTIRIESSVTTQTVGARVVVRDPLSNQTVLDYWSELSSITFLLDDTLKSMYADNLSNWIVLVAPYTNASALTPFTFNMKVYDGKSYPDRSHGSVRTMYWSDISELTKLQVFTYEGGTIDVKGISLPLNAGITSLNIASLNIGNDETLTVHSTANLETTPQWIGDSWGEKVPTTEYTIHLVYNGVCNDNFPAMRVFYTDADGCGRFLGGKIVKETTASKGDTYGRIDDIYSNVARRHIKEDSKLLTVAYSDIAHNAYITDILMNDTVRMVNYNGDLVDISPNTNKLTAQDPDGGDYEIEYLINSEK